VIKPRVTPRHPSRTNARHQMAYACIGAAMAGALPIPLDGVTRALIAWCAFAAVYLVLAWWLAVEFDAERTRERAQMQDSSRPVMFFLCLVTGLASVAAIVFMLSATKGLPLGPRAAHIALAVLALAESWLLIHTVFAFRYAHRYYGDEKRKNPDGPGLSFPGDQDPDYFDFLYHALVIGMTSQVSDVQVISREMRRLTMVHGVLAFAFNMLVLALSINVIAGAL
jgi:uncharacterized membrane protein